MSKAETYEFASFRVDVGERLIWNGDCRVDLRGKPFDVLAALLRGSGKALTKDAILREVWHDVAVEEANLTVAVSQLRKVLRQESAGSEFIETLPGRGYRFVPHGQPALAKRRRDSPDPERFRGAASNVDSEHIFVGRQSELNELEGALRGLGKGASRVLFFVGDAGIGKTTLLDRFCSSVERAGAHVVTRSECLGSYSSREPYSPVLMALSRLCKTAWRETGLDLIERVAPTWAGLLAYLYPPDRVEAIARATRGTSSALMLRELASVLELMTERQPLVWRLEDLHWGDPMTLELVAYLARYQELGRLLLIASCRPTENRGLALLMDDLSLRGMARKIALESLSRTDVEEYLASRFAGHSFTPDFAPWIYERTGGTPLFLVQWLDALVDKGLIRRDGAGWALEATAAHGYASVPSTTAQTIIMQFEGLEPRERLIFEVASVAGAHFGIVAIADILNEDCVELEHRCLRFAAQGRFLRVVGEGEWPDGTHTTVFSFVHSLYQEVLYGRIGAAARARWHLKLGRRMESAYGQRAVEIATELAVHFEAAGDHASSARYLCLAGRTAQKRLAYAIAAEQLRRGLSHLELVADGPAKLYLELDLQSALGAVLAASSSPMDAATRRAYSRVRELSGHVGSIPLTTLFGAWMTLFTRGEYAAADELASQLSAHGSESGSSDFPGVTRVMIGLSALYLGRLSDARRELEAGLALIDFDRRPLPASFEIDPAFIAYNLVWADWIAGFPDKAVSRIERALASTQVEPQSPGLAYLLHFASVLHEERGEYDIASARAQAKDPWCREFGFLSVLIDSQLLIQKSRGRDTPALSSEFEAVVARVVEQGIRVAITRLYALLSDALSRDGRQRDAMQALRTAFEWMTSTQERWWEAELHRLHGQLWLRLLDNGGTAAGCDRGTSGATTPEACFQRALEVSQAQGARSFELRAATSLARLWTSQGRREAARRLLENTYGAFDEGFTTRDLQAARTLLDSISESYSA